MAHLGGLNAARPKQLLDLLQPEFPELQLQNLKWWVSRASAWRQPQPGSHACGLAATEPSGQPRASRGCLATWLWRPLPPSAPPAPCLSPPPALLASSRHLQKQRTKATQGKAQTSGGSQSQPDDSQQGVTQQQQQPGVDSRRRHPSEGGSSPPRAAADPAGPRGVRSSGSSRALPRLPHGGLSPLPAGAGQQQRRLVCASAQPPGGGAPLGMDPAAQKRQQIQSAVAAALQGWQRQSRVQLLPWEPYLLPEAHRLLGIRARTILCYRQARRVPAGCGRAGISAACSCGPEVAVQRPLRA